ncbi:uncharacterized protein METZ01_LOCUS365464 [marine metagenome]|uniref:Uncharacterized protein n=1 Tax=marine metagenome TaxID=408172 RepID=A0A382SRN6_9ZZZZ
MNYLLQLLFDVLKQIYCKLNIVYVVCIVAPIITRHCVLCIISTKELYCGTKRNYSDNIVAIMNIKLYFVDWLIT